MPANKEQFLTILGKLYDALPDGVREEYVKQLMSFVGVKDGHYVAFTISPDNMVVRAGQVEIQSDGRVTNIHINGHKMSGVQRLTTQYECFEFPRIEIEMLAF